MNDIKKVNDFSCPQSHHRKKLFFGHTALNHEMCLPAQNQSMSVYGTTGQPDKQHFKKKCVCIKINKLKIKFKNKGKKRQW